jgi:anti-sigma B factor antagonist
MKVNYSDVNGVTMVELEGRIMLSDGSAFELRDCIRELLAMGRKNILLNLAGITYIDSAAVGQLIDAHKRARQLDGEVKLLKLTARVDNMLEITKLYRVFDIYNDTRTATATFVHNETRTFPGQLRPGGAAGEGPTGSGSAPGPG